MYSEGIIVGIATVGLDTDIEAGQCTDVEALEVISA